MALGKAVVNITANLAPLKRGLASARLLVGASMKRFASGVLSGISSIIRRTMTAITRAVRRAAKIITVAFIAIGAASVKFASDAAEANNLFEVSFGSLTSEMEDWTRKFSKALQLNQTNVKGYLGTFNLMLVSMGFGADQAAEMSTRLTELTVDLASLRNLGFEEAFTKITGGLVGEIRPLRRVGVLIDENTVKTAALTAGIIKEGEELTQTQKVMGRFQAMIKQTSRDTGDFARTRDEGNNVFKTFAEILKTTGETIGEELLPPVQKITLAMRNWLSENQKQVGTWARVFVDSITEAVQILEGDLAAFMHKVEFDGLPAAVGSSVEMAVEKIKEVFRDNLPAMKEFALDWGTKIGAAIAKGIREGLKSSGKAGIRFFESIDIIGAEIRANELRATATERGVQLPAALPFTRGPQRKVGSTGN